MRFMSRDSDQSRSDQCILLTMVSHNYDILYNLYKSLITLP